jgi:ribulose 1,5-bisphosphate synthetase/thiazole synthase
MTDRFVKEPEREIPVIDEVDVIVCGAGATGFATAVAAARGGAQTLLIERTNFIGGLLAAMPINAYFTYDGTKVIGGIAQELVDRLVEIGACKGHTVDPRLGSATAIDSEAVKGTTLEMVEEAGAKILFHTWITSAVMEGNRIRGVIVENKSGRNAILSKVVIDTSGDGDVCVLAGADFEIKERKKIQPGTLMFKMDNVDVDKIRLAIAKNPASAFKAKGQDLEMFLNAETFVVDGFPEKVEEARKNGDIPPDYPMSWVIIATQPRPDEVIINMAMTVFFHATDAYDLTRAEIEGRKRIPMIVRFLRKYIPGFEKAYLTASHPVVGVRESRRIVGDYILATDDVLQNRTFEDGVMVTPWRPASGHNPDGKLVDETYPKEGITGAELPYRCLLPKGIEGLLVAGRCLSSSGEAQNALRNMAPCMATGHAAGTAAAMAVSADITPREVDPKQLRGILVEQGMYLKSYKKA